jgi:protein-disulfide isomerase
VVFSLATQFISRRKVLMSAFAGAGALLFALAWPMPHAISAPYADISPEEFMKAGDLPENNLGKADAPHTIVEYSSLTCPHCADFHKDIFPKLKEKYIDTGQVRYILREFPLDNVAAAGFVLARCVENDKRFEFIGLLYHHQEEWAFKNNPIPELQKFAKQVGFTEERFNQCIADEKTLKYVEWVRDRAHKLFAVRGTPSFFVDGKFMKGNATIEKFDELLTKK